MSITWSFDSRSYSPTATTGPITGGAIAAGSGLVAFDQTSWGAVTGLGYTTEPVLKVGPTSGTSTIAAAVSNSAYFTFTVTVPAGQSWTPSTITFNAARGGTSTPRQVQFAKADGTLLGAAISVTTVRPTFSAYTADISALGTVAGGSTVTLRCYVSCGANVSIELDDITVATGAGPSTAAFTATVGLTASAQVATSGAPGIVDNRDGTLTDPTWVDHGDGTGASTLMVDNGDGTMSVTGGTAPTGGDWTGSTAWNSAAAWGADTGSSGGGSTGGGGTQAVSSGAQLAATVTLTASTSNTVKAALTATVSLSASGSGSTPTGRAAGPAFDMRLVAYTPLGARGAIIPDLGFTVTDTSAGPTLQATVSTAIYGTLPTSLEIGVEWWNSRTLAWVEGRDSRFAVTQFDADDRDRTGKVTLQGVGIGAFLLAAAALNGVTPYTATNVRSEAAATSSSVAVNGYTFTWSSHVLAAGDRVKVTSVGTSKGLTAGSVYYVRNATASTFQLSATPGGAIKSCGTASNVGMSRVVTRVVFNSGSHSFRKSDAVSVTGGTTIGLNDGTIYYVVNPTPATVQLADKPGGIPLELSAANTAFTNIYRNLDGQRVFTNATPGTVMDAVFLEARNRGWGVGGDGTMMLHGWQTGQDSIGNAWTSLANDPETPGVGLGFQPGTPGTAVLQALLDNQYAEWYTSNGRTIHLVNYGTGNDHSVDPTPMRIGTTATAVKVQTDLTSMRNAITVRGVGNIIQTVTAAPGAWGRLEMWETAAGATSNTLAAKQGKNDLAANGAATAAYTVTETAQQAAFLPLTDYSRGDWVAVQLAGTGWTRLRCVGWTFSKDPGGTITVTSNLANIKRTLIARLAAKSSKQTAGLSQTSTPAPSITADDNRKAAYPLGVTATTSGLFTTDGSAAATVTVTWLPVTTDIDGGDLAADLYEVWIRPEGAQQGAPVGQTHGLNLDAGPYPSGKTYGIAVRAKSSTGAWGELSPEVEVTTGYPVAIPNPPTAPTVTGKLGSVRVAWDGNLVDPTLGNQAPENGFAYVYAAYSTSSAGTYIPAGSNMGNAGYTPITGLTIGTTYWFALFAVNTIGVVSAMSPAVQFTVVGVKGPDIEVNSVTSNTIAAGAVSADKFDAGTVPSGSPVNRVPMPLTATAFWQLALTGSGVVYAAGTGAAAGTNGITLTGVYPTVWLTQKLADTPSGALHLSGLCVNSTVTFYVREWTATGTHSDYTAGPVTPAGLFYNLSSTTVSYAVFAQIHASTSSDVLESAQVFEVVGAGGTGQAAQLSPSGLRLFDSNGNLALDLTTATKQFLNIYDTTGGDPVSIASIDQSGNADFTEISGNGFDLNGAQFTDETSPTTLTQSTPNNASFGQVPLLDRLGRGAIYDAKWNTLDGVVVSTQYQRIAQDSFTLEHGRTYSIQTMLAGLQTTNNSGVNVYVELQFKASPLTSVTDGWTAARAVVYNGDTGYFALPPLTFTASNAQSTIDTTAITNRVLPAGVPIYWQVNTNLSATPTSSYTLHEYGTARGLTVIDVGSSYLTRPDGSLTLADTTDRTTSGGASGTTSSGTTATSTTRTWTASWSRSWHDSGSTIVSGTGQYTNGAALYQGNGVTPMGSKFGFASLGLSGKTITAMSLYLYFDYFAYSGQSALLGTHGDASAPATYTGSRANAWSAGWSGGSGKWVSVPSSLWAGFASGTYRGFSLGVDGSNSRYAYAEGATMGRPPKISITWH